MVAQTIPTPPIVIEPDVEPFMDDDMKQIRDIQIRVALDVADARGIPIERIRVFLYRSPEEPDWPVIFFEILVDTADEVAFSYNEAVIAGVFDAAKTELNAEQIHTLNNHTSESVEWLR